MEIELLLLKGALGALAGVFTLLWYLLRQKDAKQQKEITDIKAAYTKEIEALKAEFDQTVDKLWEKHDEDAKRLHELELKVAEKHYNKTELDGKFQELKDSFSAGLDKLGDRFEKFSETVLDRLTERQNGH